MAKQIKLKDGSSVRYPEDADLKEILAQIESEDIMGSFVLSKDASEADKVKYTLCKKIVEYKLKYNLTQKSLAEKLNLDEPETSRVLHYKIERYSIERLLSYARVLYPKLTLEILSA